MRDLDDAIAVSKQAVAAMLEGYPYRVSALNTLGNDLRQRNERTRELGDLLTAIDRYGASAMTVFEETAIGQTVMEHIGTATYLHFSSHGVFDAGSPLESGLILSAGERLTLGDLLSSSKTYEARLTLLANDLASAQGVIRIEVDPNDTPLNIVGWLDEANSFRGNVRLTEHGGNVAAFVFLASDLKREGSDELIGRQNVRLVGDAALAADTPKDFQVTVGSLKLPGTY
jgi:CHAT domain